MNEANTDVDEQGAPFEIEGPDEDACVWLVGGAGSEAVVLLLGQRDALATKMADWLAAIDFGA